MTYVKPTHDGVILCVRVQPRSKKTMVAGTVGECLKVRVKAPPVEGAANEACRDFLAELFDITSSRVQIVSGSKSRLKKILLRGLDEESVSSRIAELLQESQ